MFLSPALPSNEALSDPGTKCEEWLIFWEESSQLESMSMLFSSAYSLKIVCFAG